MGYKPGRTVLKAVKATLTVSAFSIATALLFTTWHRDVNAHVESAAQVSFNDEPAVNSQNATIWELIKSDGNMSRFAEVLGKFKDIAGGLDAPKAQFTVYVPTNEAFKKEKFPWDLPWFYWYFFVGYHMGPGSFSKEALLKRGTVGSFINADIFFKYKQRISTQQSQDGLTFNHMSKAIKPEIAAVNGYIHQIDTIIKLPDSTSDILRDWSTFSTFRAGLIQTGVATVVNDTSTHNGQTVFAPTNRAFKKLGPSARKFLFSVWGTRYLKALLKYHVVSNHTLFTDVYFQTKGQGQVDLAEGTTLDFPTLIPNLNLSTSIESRNQRLAIRVNDVATVTSPDIVVMDGVVHGIDTVLMPPIPWNDLDGAEVEDDEEDGEQDEKKKAMSKDAASSFRKPSSSGSWLESTSNWWHGADSRKMSVEELIMRLQPFVDLEDL